MTTKNGLPCNSVIRSFEDEEKHWWLHTECGVVELADSELERWWANPEAVVQTRVYDALDGARPRGPSFNAAAIRPDGRVWFANGTVVQMGIRPGSRKKPCRRRPTSNRSSLTERNSQQRKT